MQIIIIVPVLVLAGFLLLKLRSFSLFFPDRWRCFFFSCVCSAAPKSGSDHSVSVVTVIKAIVLDVPRIEILRTIRGNVTKGRPLWWKCFRFFLFFKLKVFVYNLAPVANAIFLLLKIIDVSEYPLVFDRSHDWAQKLSRGNQHRIPYLAVREEVITARRYVCWCQLIAEWVRYLWHPPSGLFTHLDR